jgi:hypothetical protein
LNLNEVNSQLANALKQVGETGSRA